MKSLKLFSRFNILSMVFAVSFSLVSCSSQPDSLTVIPQDASLVMSIDIYSIAKKGKFYDLKDYAFYQAFKKEIDNENSQTSKLFKDISDDPSATGVNLKKDLFFFWSSDQNTFGLAIDLKSRKKFEKMVTAIQKELGEESIKIQQEKKFSYLVQEAGGAMAWDDDKVLILTSRSYAPEAALMQQLNTLFSLKEADRITANAEFVKFYKEKTDLSFWCSTNFITQNAGYKHIINEVYGEDFDISDSYLSCFLSFEKGKASLRYKFKPNEKMEKLMEENDVFNNRFNEALLSLFPQQSYGLFSISVNPQAYYNLLMKYDFFKNAVAEVEAEDTLNIKEIIDGFKGSAVFSLYDIREIERTWTDWEGENITSKDILPLIGFAFDLNGDQALKNLMARLPESGVCTKVSDNYYVWLDGGSSPFYFTFNDKQAILTNDSVAVQAFGKGGFGKETFGANKLSKEIKERNFYGYLNLNTSEYPAAFQDMASKNLGEKPLGFWNEFAQSLEARNIDKYTAELVFNTQDKSTNSLQSLLQLIDKFYKFYTGQ